MEELRRARAEEQRAEENRSRAQKERWKSFRESVFGTGRSTYHQEEDDIKETLEFEEKFGDLERAWHRFEKRATSEAFVITIEEVPFVTRPLLRRFLPDVDKRSGWFKTLAKRWHPDKFQQRFQNSIAKNQQVEVMERVKVSFQIIQELCRDCQ